MRAMFQPCECVEECKRTAAERMEKANEKTEELMKKQETIDAEKEISGKADAGEEEKKEITNEQYAKDVLAGKIVNEE